VAALKIAKRAVDTASPTQSGDSEDSVAAVQDWRAGGSSFPVHGYDGRPILEVEASHELEAGLLKLSSEGSRRK